MFLLSCANQVESSSCRFFCVTCSWKLGWTAGNDRGMSKVCWESMLTIWLVWKSCFSEAVQWLRTELEFGTWEQSRFRFRGRGLCQEYNRKSIKISMSKFVQEMEPVSVPKHVKDDLDAPLEANVHSQIRGGVGQLQWLQLQIYVCRLPLESCRADLRLPMFMISWASTNWCAKPNRCWISAGGLCQCRHLLSGFSGADAAWANGNDRSSTSGHVIMAAHPNILRGESSTVSVLAWNSRKIRRVVRSSLGAVALEIFARKVWTEHPHTANFSCTFTHFILAHLHLHGSRCRTTCLHKRALIHMSSRVWLFVVSPCIDLFFSFECLFLLSDSLHLLHPGYHPPSGRNRPVTKPNAHPQNEEYCPVAIRNPLTESGGVGVWWWLWGDWVCSCSCFRPDCVSWLGGWFGFCFFSVARWCVANRDRQGLMSRGRKEYSSASARRNATTRKADVAWSTVGLTTWAGRTEPATLEDRRKRAVEGNVERSCGGNESGYRGGQVKRHGLNGAESDQGGTERTTGGS